MQMEHTCDTGYPDIQHWGGCGMINYFNSSGNIIHAPHWEKSWENVVFFPKKSILRKNGNILGKYKKS